jgi:hypothetical protein
MIYGITAVDYLTRALRLCEGYSIDGEVCRFMYAALELRCCIERTLFEYLALMKWENLSQTMEKLYRAKDLRKTILDEDPDFLKKQEFINLLAKTADRPERVVIPDLDLLSSFYGQLNGYVHALKRPDETVEDALWWMRLKELLSKAQQYLESVLRQPTGYIELDENGRAIFLAWKEGQLTDVEVMESFRS